jgi:hypothetical protein
MKNKLTIGYVLVISAVLVIIAVASYVHVVGNGNKLGTKRTDILATWKSGTINIPETSIASLKNVQLNLVVSKDNTVTVYSEPSTDNVVSVSVFENGVAISPPIIVENDVYDSIQAKVDDIKVCDSYMLFIMDNDVGRFAKAFSPTALTIPIDENVKISFHYYGYTYVGDNNGPIPLYNQGQITSSVMYPATYGYPIIDNIELIG